MYNEFKNPKLKEFKMKKVLLSHFLVKATVSNYPENEKMANFENF
jgi:hypothetical protein